MRRQVRLCQDYLADARAAAHAPQAEDYAEYLLSLARVALAPSAAVTLGMGDRRSNLTRRIHMLLNTHQTLERRPPRNWNLACLFLGLIVLAGIAVVRLDARQPVEDRPAQAA